MTDVDRMELELRQLQGVVSIGFERTPTEQLVRILLNQREFLEETQHKATAIANAHLEGTSRVVIEQVSMRTLHSRAMKRIRLENLWIESDSSCTTIEVRASLKERQFTSRSTVLQDQAIIRREVANVVLKAVSGIVQPSPDLSLNFSLLTKSRSLPLAVVSVRYLTQGASLDLVGVADASDEQWGVARATLAALNRVVLWPRT